MGKRTWSVVLVPEGGGAIRSLRIPVRVLYAALGVAGLGLLLVASSIGIHFWNLEGWKSLKVLRHENVSLRTHLATVNQSLERVEGMVREGEQMERQARLLAGLDPVDRETRQLGVGGPLLDNPSLSHFSDPAVEQTVREQSERLDSLARRVSFQRTSFEQTLDQLRSVGDRLAHTPSICPLRDQYVVSAAFGWRTDPFTNQRAFHSGLDLRAPTGTQVHAAAGGEVEYVGRDGEFGLCVRIRHGYGYETAYCHLGSTKVEQGQQVDRGMVIGGVGTSGRSTGPHLHYEVYVDGKPVDPSAHILTPRTIVD